jgi:3-oxoacyl-[acyl-carrier-protein] synthase-1
VRPISIEAAGLVTGVGLGFASTCAALRCSISAFAQTRFADASGEWITGAEVPLPIRWRGRDKLVRMLAMALRQCLLGEGMPAREVPLLLVVAEASRPGRPEGLDETLLSDAAELLRVEFHGRSQVLARGRVGGVEAMIGARELLDQGHRRVVVAGVDSFLSAATLHHYETGQRLRTAKNSNGFAPGEGAGAILVGHATGKERNPLYCLGAGLGHEEADRDPRRPLRGDGLVGAIRAAFASGGTTWRDVDYRIADVAGEQRAFKEATLAVMRLMRERKETFELWHPADCVGEVGAAVVPCVAALAMAAARKGYAPGRGALCHFAGDDGRRGALVLRAALAGRH